jgi:hypothetical protein
MSSWLNRFQLVEGFKSSSASRTDIWEVKDTQTGSRYIFKSFVSEFQTFDRRSSRIIPQIPLSADLLIHELNVYRSLRTRLIDPPEVNARNVLCIAGDGQFDAKELFEFVQKNRPELSRANIQYNIYENLLFLLRLSKTRNRESITLKRSTPTIQKKDLEIPFGNVDVVRLDLPIQYRCFFTPKIDRLSLADAIENGTIRSLDACMRYVYLLFVTLLLTSSVGVNQNDLHWGNILLSQNYYGPNAYHKRVYFLVFNDRLILIDNPYIPFLYDFDRAAIQNKIIPALEENKDMYSRGGNCPRYNPKRDFVKMLCCLWHYLRILSRVDATARTYQNEIMTLLIRDETVRQAIRNSHDACWMTTADDSNSVLCLDEHLNTGISSRAGIVQWASERCSYKSCTLSELRDVVSVGSQSASHTKVVSMCNRFKKDLTSGHLSSREQLQTTVRANIQIVNVNRKYNLSAQRKKLLDTLTQQLTQLILSEKEDETE